MADERTCPGFDEGWHEDLNAAPPATWHCEYPSGRFNAHDTCDDCLRDLVFGQDERHAVLVTPIEEARRG